MSGSDPGVQPALSPSEWQELEVEYVARICEWPGQEGEFQVWDVECEDEYREASRRHALAALALYQQPFGFTHDDVELLREMEDLFTTVTDDNGNMHEAAKARRHEHEEQKGLLSLAARIAALLPPEEG